MMDSQKTGIILLIKSALTGEKYTLPEDFDLKEAFDIANKHGIGSMFYYGALNCGIKEDNPIIQEAFLITCTSLSRNTRQKFEMDKLYAKFDETGIEYMPLKGAVLGDMYPKFEMRVMSDVDILIKLGQYDKIRPIMFDLGYKEKDVTDHEIQWNKPALYVELHSRLIPSYNKDYFAYYGDGWQLAKDCDGSRYSMTDEDQMIYLFTHFSKHYRDAGIGLKHIVDLWIYRKSKPSLDEQYIKCELEKLQLQDFYNNIIDTLDIWFSDKKSNEKAEVITDYIFDCGAAGKEENNIISTMLKNSGKVNVTKYSKFKLYWFYIFYPYEKMCVKYPFLKKAPAVLPIMWIVRFFGALLNPKKCSGVESVESRQIIERQHFLNFVGLDFNFKE